MKGICTNGKKGMLSGGFFFRIVTKGFPTAIYNGFREYHHAVMTLIFITARLRSLVIRYYCYEENDLRTSR